LNQTLDLSTRDKILQMLKTQGELSAKQITEQIGITSMAIRRHLGTLEKEGLIASTTYRQPMGRPSAAYSLTVQAESFFPKKYHALTLDLLGELEGEAGEAMVNHLFDLRKKTLAAKYAERMQGSVFADKVSALAELQNENGYMVELTQKSDDEYVLMEHNCPIAQIANKYNHACTCELNLFESLLNADVERTECLAKGDRKCVYRIRKQPNA